MPKYTFTIELVTNDIVTVRDEVSSWLGDMKENQHIIDSYVLYYDTEEEDENCSECSEYVPYQDYEPEDDDEPPYDKNDLD